MTPRQPLEIPDALLAQLLDLVDILLEFELQARRTGAVELADALGGVRMAVCLNLGPSDAS